MSRFFKSEPETPRDTDSVTDCKLCATKFSLVQRKFLCRRCGDVVCNSCSKNKKKISRYAKDVVRVCDSCHEQKELETPRNGVKVTVVSPPNWVDPAGIDSCHKCLRKPDKLKSRQLHHCRTCGRMACTPCTQKLDLPACFMQKGKNGPTRVCDPCVMMLEDPNVVLAGSEEAKLAQQHEQREQEQRTSVAAAPPIEEAPAPPADDDNYSDDDVVLEKINLSPPPAAPTKPARTESLVSPEPVRTRGISMQESKTIRVQWENPPSGEEGEAHIAEIPCLPTTQLSHMHAMIKKKCPDLANMEPADYSYLCAGEAIHPAHFHVFEMRHLEPVLCVRHFGRDAKQGFRNSVAIAAAEAIEAAKTRAKQAKEKAAAQKEKAKVERKLASTRCFVAPEKKQISKDVQKRIGDSKQASKKGMGLPPGLSAPVVKKDLFAKTVKKENKSAGLSGLSGADLFKARAQQCFGGLESTEAIEVDDLPAQPDGYLYGHI